jgi:hypothetical protein
MKTFYDIGKNRHFPEYLEKVFPDIGMPNIIKAAKMDNIK